MTTAPNRIWWIRHGPTHQKTFVGWRDVPADLTDRAKLSRLDAALPSEAALISSDLRRCVETAAELTPGRKLLPPDRDLREFNFGAWDGLTFDEVAARDPVLSRRFWDEPGDLRAPDGESWNDVDARVSAAVRRLLVGRAGQDLIVVAHFGVILTQLARCEGQTVMSALGQKIEPLSITRIDIGPETMHADQVNVEI